MRCECSKISVTYAYFSVSRALASSPLNPPPMMATSTSSVIGGRLKPGSTYGSASANRASPPATSTYCSTPSSRSRRSRSSRYFSRSSSGSNPRSSACSWMSSTMTASCPPRPSVIGSRYGPAVPAKYFTVGSVATLVHHRGPTTLPGHPPGPADGPTVLCLHDVAGNGNMFADVLDALAEGHRPIAFDFPAHGRSGGLDGLGAIDAMAAHAKALGDVLGLTSPVLLGDGMGAAVALEVAGTWPEWPAAVVLCGGASATPAPDPATITQVREVTAGRARRQFA